MEMCVDEGVASKVGETSRLRCGVLLYSTASCAMSSGLLGHTIRARAIELLTLFMPPDLTL